MKTSLIFFLSFLFVDEAYSQQEFHWLMGTWKLKDKPVYEVWRAGNETKTLYGKSFRVNVNDTTVLEKLALKYLDNAFYYISDVAENKTPIHFKISQYDSLGFMAENPLHDFPKKISYTIVRKEKEKFIEAFIEGNGKVIRFSFEKID
jgi:hypothetical protein